MIVALLATLLLAVVPVHTTADLGPCGQEIVSTVNQARVAAGLRPLRLDWRGHWVARRWSVHMRETRILEHSGTPGYGEVVGTTPDRATLLVGWQTSPEHRAILMDPLATTIGPGCAGEPDRVWGTAVLR